MVYDLTIRLSNPDDPGKFTEVQLGQCSREKLLEQPILISNMVRFYEDEHGVPDGETRSPFEAQIKTMEKDTADQVPENSNQKLRKAALEIVNAYYAPGSRLRIPVQMADALRDALGLPALEEKDDLV